MKKMKRSSWSETFLQKSMDLCSNHQAEILLVYTITIALLLLLLTWLYELCLWVCNLYYRIPDDPEVGGFDVHRLFLRLWGNLGLLEQPLRHQRVIEKLLPAALCDGHNNKTGSNSNTECVICLEEFVSGDLYRILPFCKHVYHSECIIRWFSDKLRCPICRSSMYFDA